VSAARHEVAGFKGFVVAMQDPRERILYLQAGSEAERFERVRLGGAA
jgi:hypothetical protein